MFEMGLKIIDLKLHLPEANQLTHCGLVTSYGGRDLGQHWLR